MGACGSACLMFAVVKILCSATIVFFPLHCGLTRDTLFPRLVGLYYGRYQNSASRSLNTAMLWSHLEVLPLIEVGAVELTCWHGSDTAHWGMPLVGLPLTGSQLEDSTQTLES